jgi:S-adenosylmethionine decarboxylase
MKYNKGLHIICDIDSATVETLSNMELFKTLVHEQIQLHNLTSTGSVFHSFSNGGFTAVVGLTESHLSVHTWPEFGKATFDIFLSNFMQVNNGTCETIAASIQEYFGGKVSQIHRIQR